MKGAAMEAVERRTYRIEEVAKMLGISRAAAYNAAARGDFPSIRIGKRIVVPRGGVEKLIADSGEARAS
jgi:excisionase family DNA binding protein